MIDAIATEVQFLPAQRGVVPAMARYAHRDVILGSDREPPTSGVGAQKLSGCVRQRPLARLRTAWTTMGCRTSAITSESGVVCAGVCRLTPRAPHSRNAILVRLSEHWFGYAPSRGAMAAISGVRPVIPACGPAVRQRGRDVGSPFGREYDGRRAPQRVAIHAPSFPVPIAKAPSDGASLTVGDGAARHSGSIQEVWLNGD